jgi:hypothetical protein
MQALRQVLTPLGLYNCPAHRGVEKAKIDAKDAYADAARAVRTGAELTRVLDQFDASQECREVTCLYNSVNWWLDELIRDPAEPELEVSEDRGDFFL